MPTPRPQHTPQRGRALHRWFDAGVLFKGAEGAVEILAGAWLAFDPAIVHNAIFRLTAKELLQDPADVVAGTLRHWADAVGTGHHSFATLYLIAHGVVKLVLAVG